MRDQTSQAQRDAVAKLHDRDDQQQGWVAQQFPTLDAYLAHLKRESELGGKWYREVKPGLYQLETGNLHLDTPKPQKRVFTRAELEKKFGFSN